MWNILGLLGLRSMHANRSMLHAGPIFVVASPKTYRHVYLFHYHGYKLRLCLCMPLLLLQQILFKSGGATKSRSPESGCRSTIYFPSCFPTQTEAAICGWSLYCTAFFHCVSLCHQHIAHVLQSWKRYAASALYFFSHQCGAQLGFIRYEPNA
jgi:hypothetical protein